MKGYKGMDSDMRCRGMQYEVGKTYHVDGSIFVCRNGLHFCQNLKDVFAFYERGRSRFFEVEASGTVKTVDRKSAASELMVVRELTDVEINRIVYGDGYGDGYGYGNGYGNGNGDGYSNGDGYGNGYGNSYGNGYSNGNGIIGYGYGDGYSNGDGRGNGDGNGYGNGNIQRILMAV